MSNGKKDLTVKQKKFCEYYILYSGNAAKAAFEAGYSPKTAKVIGAENLTKPDIKKYIKELAEKEDAARIASMNEVLEYLTRTMRREEKESINVGNELCTVPTKVQNATKAAELLGKYMQLWDNPGNASGEGVTIIDDIKAE